MGLEGGGVHHQESDFDLLDLFITFNIVDIFGKFEKVEFGPQL